MAVLVQHRHRLRVQMFLRVMWVPMPEIQFRVMHADNLCQLDQSSVIIAVQKWRQLYSALNAELNCHRDQNSVIFVVQEFKGERLWKKSLMLNSMLLYR